MCEDKQSWDGLGTDIMLNWKRTTSTGCRKMLGKWRDNDRSTRDIDYHAPFKRGALDLIILGSKCYFVLGLNILNGPKHVNTLSAQERASLFTCKGVLRAWTSCLPAYQMALITPSARPVSSRIGFRKAILPKKISNPRKSVNNTMKQQ